MKTNQHQSGKIREASQPSLSKSTLPRAETISSEDLLKMKDHDMAAALQIVDNRDHGLATRRAAHLLSLKMAASKDAVNIGPVSLTKIGSILHRSMPAAAFHAYAMAQKADPGNPVLLSGMAAALLKLRRPEQAMKLSHVLTMLWPKNQMSIKTAIKVKFALGEHNEALALCEKWLKSDMGNRDAWRLKAGLLVGAKRYQEAVKCCQAGLEKFPNAKRIADILRHAERQSTKCKESPL